jgi:hypothetical protein
MTAYRGRHSLWWLIVPFVFFVAAIPLVNRADPVILGIPFFAFWCILGVIVTPVSIWLAARGDPLYHADEPEATDVD